MANPQFRFQLNIKTDRWEVFWRRPNGNEIIVSDYATAVEAMMATERGNGGNKEPQPTDC